MLDPQAHRHGPSGASGRGEAPAPTASANAPPTPEPPSTSSTSETSPLSPDVDIDDGQPAPTRPPSTTPRGGQAPFHAHGGGITSRPGGRKPADAAPATAFGGRDGRHEHRRDGPPDTSKLGLRPSCRSRRSGAGDAPRAPRVPSSEARRGALTVHLRARPGGSISRSSRPGCRSVSRRTVSARGQAGAEGRKGGRLGAGVAVLAATSVRSGGDLGAARHLQVERGRSGDGEVAGETRGRADSGPRVGGEGAGEDARQGRGKRPSAFWGGTWAPCTTRDTTSVMVLPGKGARPVRSS